MLLYNGDIYEGDWKNDKAEGKGIYHFITGDKFDGDKTNKLDLNNSYSDEDF